VKLGEALTLRSQLLTRIAQLRDRLKSSVLVQEGETAPEDPALLLEEFDAVATQVEQLIAQINRVNLQTHLPSGETLTEALARRDALTLRHTVLRQTAEAASEPRHRYARAEIRILPNVDVAKLREQADGLARQRRELDAAIQETNWTTELPE
jgi:hypothetical protein